MMMQVRQIMDSSIKVVDLDSLIRKHCDNPYNTFISYWYEIKDKKRRIFDKKILFIISNNFDFYIKINQLLNI